MRWGDFLWGGHGLWSQALDKGTWAAWGRYIMSLVIPVTNAGSAEEPVLVLCCRAGNVRWMFIDELPALERSLQ